MKQIKFRRPYFNDKDDKFSHFHIWGIDYPRKEQNTFPGSASHQYHKEDEQFTGLKDKNGKEIYEGDILKTSHLLIPVGVVDYREHSFEIKALDDEVYINNSTLWSYYEIIGNIHEHKHLLND